VILTSYALLRLEPELFKAIQWQVIVLDEAQAIKNPSSQIAHVAFGLQGDMRLAITGTPIENRLQDLFSLFQFVLPDLLDSERDFKSKVRPFLLRRKKEAVLKDLPPKMEQVVFVDMTETQRHTYDQWLQRTKAGLIQKVSLDGVSAHRMEILEAILRLRQLCVHPFLVAGDGEFLENSGKCEQLFQDLQEVVDSGKKVLVYSQFTTMLQLIRREVANRGWSYVYLDGATTDREGVVRQFQEEEATSIFLISLKAGGVGLNLTAADYVFLLDPWWNEAVEQQAIDRAHRVGRRGAVIARRYVTTESIEEKMMMLKKHKLNLAQGLFEECGDFTQLSLDDLIQLIF
jgi:SNF2 family DNA or RNA helicase